MAEEKNSTAFKIISLTVSIIFILLIVIVSQFNGDIPVEELKKTYAGPQSKFVTINGMNVHYRDQGSGFPLVLVHGTFSSLHTWDGWTNVLKDEFRVIRMDLPGFGLTGPATGNSINMETYTSFMDSFLEMARVERCHMAGNSLGGRITWNYAAARPEKLAKIILIDPAGYAHEPPFAIGLARCPVTAFLMRYITPRFMFKISMKEVYGDDSKITKELVDRYFNLTLREGNRRALIEGLKNVEITDSPNIEKVSTPTLIMWGSEDRWIPPEHGKRFNEDIENSRLIMYEGVGHVPMEEIPEKSARDAREFLLE